MRAIALRLQCQSTTFEEPMSAVETLTTPPLAPPISGGAALGEAPPSPAGPAPADGHPERLPPGFRLPRALQTLRFSMRQIEFVFRARRELGEVFRFKGMIDDEVIVLTSHPDHVKSLFTATPEQAPSLTGKPRCARSSGPTRCSRLWVPSICVSVSSYCRRSTARRWSATPR